MMQYIYIYILIWSIDFVFVSLFLSISTSFVAKKYMILSFEKYFLVFGCVLENTIENKFFTCCSHFLKFSQLPNKYIISFLNTETQKKQNPEKKNSSNSVKLREEGREKCGVLRSARCCYLCLIGAVRLARFVVFGLELGLRSVLLWSLD